jgi:hypothetical protein
MNGPFSRDALAERDLPLIFDATLNRIEDSPAHAECKHSQHREKTEMTRIPGSLWEWLSAIEPDERMALCVVTIVFGVMALVLTIGIVSHTIRRIHQSRVETALKRELLDRGLSVDEIARVVEATASGRRIGGRSIQ